MGGTEEEAGSSHQKKMDESEGMCRDDTSYSSCWGRICNPNRGHVLKDILRGLLVLIVLAIVITVIFLLCYFLLNDIEKKEDEVIDNLVKDFSAGGPLLPNPEILTKDINKNSPSDTELYDSGPSLRGDLGKKKEKIIIEDPNNRPIDFRTQESNKFPEKVATTEEVSEDRVPFLEVPEENQGFIHVRSFPPVANEGLLDFNFNQDGQNFDNFSDFVVAESGSECVPLRLPLCSTMPWTLTSFPNWVNNNNIRELQESSKYFQSTLISGRCSAKATEYSCAILEPACGPDGIPLPPCKAFCEDISRTCSEYLTVENKHRIALQCDRFPDSTNPNVCVDVNRVSSDTSDSILTDVKGSLPPGTTFDGQGINQPQFKDYPNVLGIPSNEDYISDTYDEISGREDLLPSTSIGSTSPDLVKIIEFADIPKEIKKLPDLQQFTPDKVAVEKISFENSPEDVKASDSETTELPVFICDHTKFLCEDGSDCLPPEAVCDGTQNCLDNSDETNCTAPEPDISEAQEDLIVSKAFVDDSHAKYSRHPSLSEMLSGSSLVAAPEPVTEPPTQRPELKFRFSSDQPFKSTRGKSLETLTKPFRNSFEPIPTTGKPILKNDINNKNSKLSLAALLSTSIKPTHKQVGAHSQNHPVFVSMQDFDYDQPSSNRRSLSDLLASSSFTSAPTRVAADDCPELQCLDGKCISISQLSDGIDDCLDGADEQ